MNSSLKWFVVLTCLCVTMAFGNEPTGAYKRIVDEMRSIEKNHAEFAHVFSIGVNDDGVDLYAMRISTTPERTDRQKNAHLLVGTHHGNESKAPVFVMYFLKSLIKRYRSPELWRGDLADIEWIILPVLNVSGYNKGQRREHGLDPNRDYPGPCNPSPGGRLQSVRTLMKFLNSRIFSGSVTVHGYLGSLTYPWGVDLDNVQTLDHNFYEQATAKACEHNGYRHGTSTEIVYPALGTYEDYVYWKHGMWSLLLELENGFEEDLRKTTQSVFTFYDQLDASPSVNNQLTGKCLRSGLPDLAIE